MAADYALQADAQYAAKRAGTEQLSTDPVWLLGRIVQGARMIADDATDEYNWRMSLFYMDSPMGYREG